MPKVLTIKKWTGMKDGGVYFSHGFQPAFDGFKEILRQEWKTEAQYTSESVVLGFCQNEEAGLSYINDLVLYLIDNIGNIYKGQSYYLLNKIAKKTDIIPTASYLSDICKGLGGSILYTSARYLGRRLTGTDNGGGSAQTTKVIDTTKNFSTEGVRVGATLYNTTVKCKGVITSLSTTTNPNDTINCSGGFSGGTATHFDNGDGYAVWADQWKDLGAEQTLWSRQIFAFENVNLIGNGNYLASIDSAEVTFSASYKQLKEGWYFRAGDANANWIAVAANKNYKGAIMLWNGWSAYWQNILYLDNEIETIKSYNNGWIFNSGSEIYFTDGYNKQFLTKFPDVDSGATLGIKPNGLLILGNKAFFNLNYYFVGRLKSGIWILDLQTREWSLAPFSYKGLYLNGGTNGGLFFDPKHNNIYIGYQDAVNTAYRIDRMRQNYRGTAPDESVIILPIGLGKKRQINKIEIDWTKNSLAEDVFDAQSVEITVSLGDGKRQLWGYGVSNAASTAVNTLKIDNTFDGCNKIEVGDEILMLNNNNRGERAFVTDISGAKTNACILSLDRGLSNNTENSSDFNILPLKKAKGKTIFTSIEMAEFYPDSFLSSQAVLEIWVKASNFSIQIEEIRLYLNN